MGLSFNFKPITRAYFDYDSKNKQLYFNALSDGEAGIEQDCSPLSKEDLTDLYEYLRFVHFEVVAHKKAPKGGMFCG